jgi:hypothetical protein
VLELLLPPLLLEPPLSPPELLLSLELPQPESASAPTAPRTATFVKERVCTAVSSL